MVYVDFIISLQFGVGVLVGGISIGCISFAYNKYTIKNSKNTNKIEGYYNTGIQQASGDIHNGQ